MSVPLQTTVETFDLALDLPAPMTLVVPAQRKSQLAQVYYFIDTGRQTATRMEVDMTAVASQIDPLRWGGGLAPLSLSAAAWPQFCIGPHSVTPYRDGKFYAGLRAFPHFVQLDPGGGSAECQVGVENDDLLSSTNWVDPTTGAMWFASWNADDMIRRIAEPPAPVRIRLWSESQGERRLMWEGLHGDFLHQVLLSADRQMAVITEMGMRPSTVPPPGHPGSHPGEWQTFRRAGMMPSKLLFLDLGRGREWRLAPSAGAPAHVEPDPQDPVRVIVSCHNIALVNGANVLFGPGVLTAYRLTANGPRREEEFSHPHFLRITSHIPFFHRGQTRIAVTSYPHCIFILDAALRPIAKVPLFDAEIPDTDLQPHFCRHEPRSPSGIAASDDGEYLVVSGSGYMWVVDVAGLCAVGPPVRLFPNLDDELVTGHLTARAARQ